MKKVLTYDWEKFFGESEIRKTNSTKKNLNKQDGRTSIVVNEKDVDDAKYLILRLHRTVYRDGKNHPNAEILHHQLLKMNIS